MKAVIASTFCTVGLCFLLLLPASAQERPAPPDMLVKRLSMPFCPAQPRSERSPQFRIPGKKVSQFTAEDWGAWIDTTWGTGQGSAVQLQIFDSFWNMIDQRWAGFPNLPLNWDSVRALYRPQIGSGLSRGRFGALMSRLWLSLQEYHTYFIDPKVDTSFGGDLNGMQRYKSGVPMLIIGTMWWDLLGAPVTALPDSTGLVYRIAPGNPLGLEPGDIVLGYDGVPWKYLYQQLLDNGVPVNRGWSCSGSTPEANTQLAFSAVGWNWGMFDTIDIVKYSSGDTLHLPTAVLERLSQTVYATDQVPVPGVLMPQWPYGVGPSVSWGVVQGTNIGYIYVWDWASPNTAQLFNNAIYDLRHNKNVEGLVIDFRMNWGGDLTYGNGGFSQLFGFDPTLNYSLARRSSTSDHMAFTRSATPWGFTPTTDPFEHPIAILIGPGCLSSGDENAFRLHFHPMARSFGKPTNGAFVGGDWLIGTSYEWPYRIPTSIMYSDVPGEGYLIHKGVQPDEQVWLTRDGVAKGKDDVVERALAWIHTLSYAHDVHLSHTSKDTLRITARVEDSLAHPLKVVATLKDGLGAVIDSLFLKDDGLHSDSAAGDGLWGCTYVPATEGTIHATIRTDDLTTGTSRTLQDASQIVFSRRALIALDATTTDLGQISNVMLHCDTTFTVQNIGFAADSITILLDPVNVIPVTAVGVVPTSFVLAPRDSQKVTFSVQPEELVPQYYQAIISVQPKSGLGQGSLSKSFTFQIVIADAVTTSAEIPKEYVLGQNFPNPFNPATTIRYGLPHKSVVQLTVYSTLGQQVAVLQSGEQEAGYHEVQFDASHHASGVYFYQLKARHTVGGQAGDFVQSKKLVLLK